ncbi:MAG TPA: GSCFA domain-containing protein [Chitinophagaceae bacterium]
MNFFTQINIRPLDPPISYRHKLMLTGSCFTEHIGNHLMDVKFRVMQNPNGILFEPVSVCNSLISYIRNRQYTADELFALNGGWHSWQHHSRFSRPDRDTSLQLINESQTAAHLFLREADWLIITLGSSFVYQLADSGLPVANCHKAPPQTFNKHLSTIEEIVTKFDETIHQLFRFNEHLKIIFTISPVRHLRDGVVDNNRSKARLIEAVHHLVNKFDRLYYFPAYELVIDVLRDYRFYDIDLAHPNYAATQFVLENFSQYCLDETAQVLSEDIRKLVVARNHKPFNRASEQHRQFLDAQLRKTKELQDKYPFLDFGKELDYFAG